MNDQIKSLYKTVILEHDKAPYHFEKRKNAAFCIRAYNEICGDRFDLYFDVNEGRLVSVSFHGFGCAISKASTSVLVKKIENQPLESARDIVALFLESIGADAASLPLPDEEMAVFAAARQFPGRLACATLAWTEFQLFLEKTTAKPTTIFDQSEPTP